MADCMIATISFQYVSVYVYMFQSFKFCLGSGSFGTVRIGNWNGQEVAVKVIESDEQESWEQEKNLYMTKLLSHDSILGIVILIIMFFLCMGESFWLSEKLN